jgi:hypothetical protein
MKFPRAIMAAASLLAAVSPAFAQTDACPTYGSLGGGNISRTEAIFTYNFPAIRILPLEVKGEPYSGRNTGQIVRTLANGTHLTQPVQVSPMFYRDSMGRTRTDPVMTNPPGAAGTTQVSRPYEINDPVAGYRYIVDDFHQIVHRIAACKPARQDNPVWLNPAAEDLGTQTMQGVTVTGQRETTTFPPGTYQGNDQTVTRVQETWRSVQLNLEFLSKTTTPEGETRTNTMTNFSAAEPDPALFRPPQGYQIIDETADFRITIPVK